MKMDLESIAFRMWKAEADRAAPNVGKHRTPEKFAQESAETRSRWLGLAEAVLGVNGSAQVGEPDDLIRRGDAMEIGSAHGWDTDLFRSAIAALPAVASSQPADLAQVKVKPLVWISTGENRYSAKSEDYKVVTDGKCWAFCPEDWPPFAGYPYLTADAAKAAAQADYEARILAAIEPQPDPRDEVIARLVEAATHLCDGIATMFPPLGQSDRVLNLRTALAAAKAVLK